MGILTYQACWDQQRQRRGPCPGEPLKENRGHLRDRKCSQIQWGGLGATSLTGILMESGETTCEEHSPRAPHFAPTAPPHGGYILCTAPQPLFPVSLGSPLVHQGEQEVFPDSVVRANCCPHMSSSQSHFWCVLGHDFPVGLQPLEGWVYGTHLDYSPSCHKTSESSHDVSKLL